MLLELTSNEGLPVFINVFQIESIRQLQSETMIGTTSGDHILVRENATEVNVDVNNLIAALQGIPNAGEMH